jgi:hypothetical protein
MLINSSYCRSVHGEIAGIERPEKGAPPGLDKGKSVSLQKGTHCNIGRIVSAVNSNPLVSVTSAAASLRMAAAEFSGSKARTAVSEYIGYRR